MASRNHGEKSTAELSRALVDERDAEFVRICLDIVLDNVNDEEGDVLDGIVGKTKC